jgi:hypothetical protein
MNATERAVGAVHIAHQAWAKKGAALPVRRYLEGCKLPLCELIPLARTLLAPAHGSAMSWDAPQGQIIEGLTRLQAMKAAALAFRACLATMANTPAHDAADAMARLNLMLDVPGAVPRSAQAKAKAAVARDLARMMEGRPFPPGPVAKPDSVQVTVTTDAMAPAYHKGDAVEARYMLGVDPKYLPANQDYIFVDGERRTLLRRLKKVTRTHYHVEQHTPRKVSRIPRKSWSAEARIVFQMPAQVVADRAKARRQLVSIH